MSASKYSKSIGLERESKELDTESSRVESLQLCNGQN